MHSWIAWTVRGHELNQNFTGLEALRDEWRGLSTYEPAGKTSISAKLNADRNRPGGSVPFDDSRVGLQPPAAKPGTVQQQPAAAGSDYINASWCQTKLCTMAFRLILAQAPAPHTVAAFWRMLLQEHVTSVVCTARETEQGEASMACFWPRTPGASEWVRVQGRLGVDIAGLLT